MVTKPILGLEKHVLRRLALAVFQGAAGLLVKSSAGILGLHTRRLQHTRPQTSAAKSSAWAMRCALHPALTLLPTHCTGSSLDGLACSSCQGVVDSGLYTSSFWPMLLGSDCRCCLQTPDLRLTTLFLCLRAASQTPQCCGLCMQVGRIQRQRVRVPRNLWVLSTDGGVGDTTQRWKTTVERISNGKFQVGPACGALSVCCALCLHSI